jgi:hypothetical protein
VTAIIPIREETPLVSTISDALSSSPLPVLFTLVMLGVGVVAGCVSRSAVERVDPNFREGAGI